MQRLARGNRCAMRRRMPRLPATAEYEAAIERVRAVARPDLDMESDFGVLCAIHASEETETLLPYLEMGEDAGGPSLFYFHDDARLRCCQ